MIVVSPGTLLALVAELSPNCFPLERTRVSATNHDNNEYIAPTGAFSTISSDDKTRNSIKHHIAIPIHASHSSVPSVPSGFPTSPFLEKRNKITCSRLRHLFIRSVLCLPLSRSDDWHLPSVYHLSNGLLSCFDSTMTTTTTMVLYFRLLFSASPFSFVLIRLV